MQRLGIPSDVIHVVIHFEYPRASPRLPLRFRWMTYKQDLMKDVIKRRGRYRSNTTIHDVPYSIRITDEIGQII